METTAIKDLARKTFRRLGYEIRRYEPHPQVIIPPDIQNVLQADPVFAEIYGKCQPYTLTSPERIYALYQTARYIIKNQIPGAFVECGVWRGGSAMVMALTLLRSGINDRDLWLYDTYTGMTTPQDIDCDFAGESALPLFNSSQRDNHNEWCFASYEEVFANLASTGYPMKRVQMIKGPVEETLPSRRPQSVAVLRLDTDWYQSTMHELTHLYPLVSKSGVVIIDDYGHWKGARQAVDSYLQANDIHVLLQRIDYTGRLFIKA